MRSRYNIIVLLIQRNGHLIDVKRDTIIQKGDRVVMFGKTAYIKELFDVKNDNKEEVMDDKMLNEMSIIDNYGSNAKAEVLIKRIPLIVKNKTLGESVLKEKYDINVVMITHEDKTILVDADTQINIGDKVMLFGPYQHIKTLFLEEIED